MIVYIVLELENQAVLLFHIRLEVSEIRTWHWSGHWNPWGMNTRLGNPHVIVNIAQPWLQCFCETSPWKRKHTTTLTFPWQQIQESRSHHFYAISNAMSSETVGLQSQVRDSPTVIKQENGSRGLARHSGDSSGMSQSSLGTKSYNIS